MTDDEAGAEARRIMPALPAVPARVRVSRGAMPLEVPRIALPGSKYLTVRYLLAAALADGVSVVRGVALSDDTAVLVRALTAMGAQLAWVPLAAGRWGVRVRGCNGRLVSPRDGVIAVGNAGAVLRLLLGVAATLPAVRFETDHPNSLGRRPNRDMLDALAKLGVAVEARGEDGLLPITLRGGQGIRGGAVTVSGGVSSQFVSALLYLGAVLPDGLDIAVRGALRSAGFVRLTLAVLQDAGVRVEADAALRRFHVRGGQRLAPVDVDVAGDVPSAAALAAAALVGGTAVKLDGLPQTADMAALVRVLRAFGAEIVPTHGPVGVLAGDTGERLMIAPPGQLRGTTIDGDTVIDAVPVLVALASVVHGQTVVRNALQLRAKESNRIDDLAAALRACGADVRATADGLVIAGRPDGLAGGAAVSGHDDHRLVQALAIAALGARAPVSISGADAVSKSYPDFFSAITRLGAQVEAQDQVVGG